MIKINIIKNNIVTNSATFQNQEQADAWLSAQVANMSFGKPERWEADTTISPLSSDDKASAIDFRDVSSMGQSHTEYLLPSEFEVQTIDLGNGPARDAKMLQIREIRNTKLSRVDQLVNIAFLNAWTAAEKTELKNYRSNLLNITEQYKTSPSLLDNLDVLQISWPTEPTEQ